MRKQLNLSPFNLVRKRANNDESIIYLLIVVELVLQELGYRPNESKAAP
jgi:hypothetical protein